jgi:hypothetical protein
MSRSWSHGKFARRAGLRLTLAVLLGAAACGPATSESATEHPGAGPATEGADGGAADSDVPAEESVVERTRLASCVIHAGAAEARGSGGLLQTASCSYNAECFAHPGGQTEPTDGFVDLACEWDRCECTIESAVPGSTPVRFRFQASEPCGNADLAQQLLLEHCMVGMELAGDAGQQGQ